MTLWQRSVRKSKKFLASRDAFTLYKPRRICFPPRKAYSKLIADLFQIDLVDLSNLASFNDVMRYLLNCIDVFTKRAWAVPVRTKSARDIVKAFEKILADRKCTMMQSDKGTEFLNTSFQPMLRRHGIHFYTSENEDLKAAIVERFNRTLKDKMSRYFTHRNARRYVDARADLLHSNNNTDHRSIGMAPSELNKIHENVFALVSIQRNRSSLSGSTTSAIACASPCSDNRYEKDISASGLTKFSKSRRVCQRCQPRTNFAIWSAKP